MGYIIATLLFLCSCTSSGHNPTYIISEGEPALEPAPAPSIELNQVTL